MANILAVDDNLELCKLIRTALERDGHRVETRQAGGALTEPLCRWADCILLDVMMPGEDGFAVCRRIRSLTDVPILFLSARTDEAAVLEGLGIGADDFLSKPFRVAELRARVAAHLRRQSRTPAHRMVRSGVAFDLTARSAAVEGKALPLTRSEYSICEYLALHAGQTFTKEQIYEAVFGIDGTADDTAVTQHIKNIRAKNNYQTNARTSPPTPSCLACLSVMIPWFVDTIAIPSPPSTFGISSLPAYTRKPGLEIFLIPEMIFSFLSAPYFKVMRIVWNAPSSTMSYFLM